MMTEVAFDFAPNDVICQEYGLVFDHRVIDKNLLKPIDALVPILVQSILVTPRECVDGTGKAEEMKKQCEQLTLHKKVREIASTEQSIHSL